MAVELSEFTVLPHDSVRTAMTKIDRNKHRVVVVVDPDGTVLGTVSDGDIRRAFLHDILPIAPVSEIMQLNPEVTTEADPEERRRLVLEARVTVLPVVSEDNRLLDVELAYEPFDS